MEPTARTGLKRLPRKIAAQARVLAKGRRNRTDLTRWLVRRPALLLAVGTYETAVLVSSRLDDRRKVLAEVKASGRIGCPF